MAKDQGDGSILRQYYLLTKPGIIRGNLMTTAAGFLFAIHGTVDFWRLLATLLGTTGIIACGCVINNYLDRAIDARMERTKQRALVTGSIPVKRAIMFGVLLGLLGMGVLIVFVNMLTAFVGLVGLFFYVVMYSYFKRHSVHGTLVGSVSGAVPPVAGYTAVTGNIDLAALLLFVILTCWQMPHFYAIAVYRHSDYAAAKLPVLSVVKGVLATKLQILAYVTLFIFASMSLVITGYAGTSYLLVLALAGVYWLRTAIQGFKTADDVKWAHQVFGVSLIVLLIFSVMISFNRYLP